MGRGYFEYLGASLTLLWLPVSIMTIVLYLWLCCYTVCSMEHTDNFP